MHKVLPLSHGPPCNKPLVNAMLQSSLSRLLLLSPFHSSRSSQKHSPRTLFPHLSLPRDSTAHFPPTLPALHSPLSPTFHGALSPLSSLSLPELSISQENPLRSCGPSEIPYRSLGISLFTGNPLRICGPSEISYRNSGIS